MSSAMIRALSPALAVNTDTIAQGLANVAAAVMQDPADGERQRLFDDANSAASVARHSVISACASIQEVSNSIATPYRKAITDHLIALERNLTRLASVRSSLTKLSAHQARGTVPPQLRRDAPKPQLTKAYADSERGREHVRSVEEATATYLNDIVNKHVLAKRDEVTSLEAGVHARSVVAACRRDVDAIATEIFKVHRVVPPTDAEGDAEMSSSDDWEVQPAVKVVRDNLLADLGFIFGHVTSLVNSSLTRKALREAKKQETATAARTAAGDVGSTSAAAADADGSADLLQVIRAEVAKAVNASSGAGKRKRDPKPDETERLAKQLKVRGIPVSLHRLNVHDYFANSSCLSPGEVRPRPRENSRGGYAVRTPSLQAPHVSRKSLTGFTGGTQSTSQSRTRRPKGQGKGRQPGRPRPRSWRLRPQSPTSTSKRASVGARSATRNTAERSESRELPRRQRPRSRESARGLAGSRSSGGSTRRNAPLARIDVDIGSCTPAESSGSVRRRIGPSPKIINYINKSDLSRSEHDLFSRQKIGKIEQGDLWLAKPLTMPDYLLNLPLPDAIHEILSRTSLATLSALAYQQEVHVSPGVHLPREISYSLSVGAKYMLHQPSNVNLLESAWKDFNRRIRWKIHFLFENEGQGEKPYDPDYDVRPHSNKMAPPLPQYIEQGLARGRLFVYDTMGKIPQDDPNDLSNHHKTLGPQIGLVRKFLLDNRYIITGTDKNLGIAVSERSWILQKSQDILNNVNDYRQIEINAAYKILDQKCLEMRHIASIAKAHVDDLEGSVSDFLRSKITLRGESHHVPKFYGIPKIHKEPVKMRPIIPCHSAIMNPAAKYVSKKLKPLIQRAATVIHGTKDLAIKLSKLSVDRRRKWYIVTGDVVAFYPNIPLQRCIDLIQTMYADFLLEDARHTDAVNPAVLRLFELCLKVGNTNLLTQFQGRIYEQLNGLAMGVADSPDLANLYGYYFEKLANVLNHPDIFFYGRYIDDCLAIVYAESEAAAVTLLSRLIQFENCTITWDCSDSHAPFLDMMLYKDEYNTLQHMPYRKRRNHQERIPWISAHPYDVKRGTFLGEMSRLAVLSSKIEHYSEALKGLVTLYIQRGYPVDKVHKWLCSNVTKRWKERLIIKADQPKGSADVLVLKSQYNLAWNYFNASQLGDTIFNYWRTWLDRAKAGLHDQEYPAPATRDSRVSPGEFGTNMPGLWDLEKTNLFNSRILVSRKRTRNMLDLTNLWKRSVIETQEDLVLDNIVETAVVAFTNPGRPFPPDVNTTVVGPSLKRSRVVEASNEAGPSGLVDEDSDNELQPKRYRRSSPAPEGWRSGALSGWSRGSRP